MEEELLDTNSTLPWSWVIEALAKSSLVSSSLLYELVSKVPPLSGVTGNEAREAIALRCLERLFNSPNAITENVGVSDPSKLRFDFSESSEAALQRITSGSKGLSDGLNLDIESFIKHKKASLSKSTLEMLNDTMLEGINPLSSSLKRISGHCTQECQEQCVLNIPFEGEDPSSSPLKCDEQDHADRIMLAEENGCSLRSGINCQQEKGAVSLCNNSPPTKKRKVDSVYEMQSKQHHSEPVGGNEILNVTEGRQCYQVNKTIGIHDGKSLEKDEEKTKTYLESRDQQHISPNNGDHYLEQVDLACKSTNLSSQCEVNRDSLAMTESQPNMCMKCNEDGELLSCSGSSCGLLFHESCLGCSISIDDQGKFFCPFCAYSRANSDYVKAKEKLSLARKNLSLFIGGRTSDKPEQDGDNTSEDDVNEDTLKNIDQTAAAKKGTNLVIKDANPRHTDLSRSSARLDVNGLVLAAQQQFSIKDAHGAEIVIQLSQGQAGIGNHAQDCRGCDGALLSGDSEQIRKGNVIFAELKRKNETSRCKITEIHGDASSESISDSEELVQYKRNDGSCSQPSRKTNREIPEVPRCRRKKVPWTAEEEAMLKKGVETYVQVEGQAIPWKSILDYGRSVFQQGRTPMDLKDKWRNITRGTSPKVK